MKECPVCGTFFKKLDKSKCPICDTILMYVAGRRVIISVHEATAVRRLINYLEDKISDTHSINYLFSKKDRMAEIAMIYHLYVKVRRLLRNNDLYDREHEDKTGGTVTFIIKLMDVFFDRTEFAFMKNTIFSFAPIGGSLFMKAAVFVIQDIRQKTNDAQVQKRRVDRIEEEFIQVQYAL